MNWIATNIRFPEDQYLKLKQKALKDRKSLAAVIREATHKIVEVEDRNQVDRKKKAVEKFMKDLDKIAEENSKHVPKGFDSTKALRNIRYQDG